MKAKFTTIQAPVRVINSDENVYIFICLNETIGTELIGDIDNQTEQTYYEYDYNEIIEKKNNINVQDIINNPEKYINYPEKEMSIEERMVLLEEQQERSDQALQDLILYALSL